MVSQKKKRYQKDGFDLDLTYIVPGKLIAMGFPAEGMAGTYRNNMVDVQRFFVSKHHMRFRIYNLCCELTYDTTKFEERTARYPFPDHNPSAFEMISRICEDMHEWYHRHAKNVIAVHCKAGKGRTGYVISCFLLYERMVTDAESALNMFSALRTYDDQGVTIPSQRRYVHYFARLLDQNGWFGGPQFSDSLDEKVGVGNQDYIGLKSEDSAQSLSAAGPSVIEHPPDASPSCENANALAADGVSVPDQSSNYKASACHLAIGGDIGPETKEYNSSKEASRAQPPPPPSIFGNQVL